MQLFFSADDIARVIELAVAPVFLLTAISGALSVLSIRMGRIIDRGRRLNEQHLPEASEAAVEADHEQRLLALRARLIHRAINLCTMSALFVCIVILSLFLDALFSFQLELFIALMFMVALACLSLGLLTFLREIEKSATAFKFGKYTITRKPPPLPK
jgi:hypothetical protein